MTKAKPSKTAAKLNFHNNLKQENYQGVQYYLHNHLRRVLVVKEAPKRAKTREEVTLPVRFMFDFVIDLGNKKRPVSGTF